VVIAVGTKADHRLLAAFADVLDYPHAPIADAVRECESLVSGRSEEAAKLLGGFRDFAEESSLGELQEAYTSAFDLDSMSDLEPTCYPYVGHHLFDENHKRSAFLVGLNERFRAHGFEARGELPDHLVVLLRFLAVCDDDALAGELLHDAVTPGLERMAGKGDATEAASGRRRYQQVLRALLLALQAEEAGWGPDLATGGIASNGRG
jgi:nitrate reductase delta subunit